MFEKTHELVFPDRPIVEIQMTTRSFTPSSIWTIASRSPGAEHLGTRTTRTTARGAHWRGIYDDKGRIMVAISLNSDLGDSWEWATIRAIRRDSPT